MNYLHNEKYFLCAYKFDSFSLYHTLIDDIIKVIMDYIIRLTNDKVYNDCNWLELKTDYFLEKVKCSVIQPCYTLNKHHIIVNELKSKVIVHTPCFPIKHSPIWTIIKDSKDKTGYFQLACICGKNQYDIEQALSKFTNFYSVPDGVLGVWGYSDFGLTSDKVKFVIDAYNKVFIVNGEKHRFQYYDSHRFNDPNVVVCVAVFANSYVVTTSSALITDFQYKYYL